MAEVHELRTENELKLSAKEGQKLWANFQDYAKYTELKNLYDKVMPAISSFEDKLKSNNDRNIRIDETVRRIDEVICIKADRSNLKEFKVHVTDNYMAKSTWEELDKKI